MDAQYVQTAEEMAQHYRGLCALDGVYRKIKGDGSRLLRHTLALPTARLPAS